MSGFELFVKAHQKKICPSCRSLLRNPIQLKCRHSICQSCANKRNKFPRCPKCKQEFPVICPFSSAGCLWEGMVEELKSHRKICGFKTALIPQEMPFLSPYGNKEKDLIQLGIMPSSDNSGRRETVQPIFKDVDSGTRACYTCPRCEQILKDAVQPACGHRICQSCADEILAKETRPCCPECGENFDEEDGAHYFPDRFVRREIKNLITICPFSEMGCNWEGKFEQYEQHVKVCRFALLACEHCGEKVHRDQIERHTASCPCAPKQCPLAVIGCSKNLPMKQSDLQNHLRMAKESHLSLLASRLASLEIQIREQQPQHSMGQSVEKRAPPSQVQSNFVEQDDNPNLRHLVAEEMRSFQDEVRNSFVAELRAREEEISQLKVSVTKLEKQLRSKNAELEDRDFRLSLIENSNHDGSMIWKIPQFSQRKADAENGKYTSIFSLPFYTGRYGYKMCLRLYIMGDGIGKGTHLSLFFVVMRGEFDNILQWPFTHKVTFKLINQAGGRDIVDTFQPDPMSSSFRKPKSDMNVASGCPRFVSHTELERGGFIVDDTIFIKCMIDISTVHHP